MKVLVLSESDVEHLLPMEACIEVMADALGALARGDVHNPLRQAIRAPGAPGLLGLMPAWRASRHGRQRWSPKAPSGLSPEGFSTSPTLSADAPAYYALKEVCVFPENPMRGLDTHLGAVILHSGETGEPLAFMNASAITAIRTAAVSTLATRLLARPESSILAILGAGVQARSHLRALPLVRSIREIRIHSRTPAKAEALAKTWDGSATIRCVAEAEAAVRGADLILTATSSREPVMRREWIAPGAHINAVGSSIAAARELDGATVAASSLFVDRRESTVNESGDYLFALREGAIGGPEHILAELGEILIGTARGRTSDEEITLFKSLGLAVEDLAAAAFLYETAKASGRGGWVDF